MSKEELYKQGFMPIYCEDCKIELDPLGNSILCLKCWLKKAEKKDKQLVPTKLGLIVYRNSLIDPYLALDLCNQLKVVDDMDLFISMFSILLQELKLWLIANDDNETVYRDSDYSVSAIDYQLLQKYKEEKGKFLTIQDLPTIEELSKARIINNFTSFYLAIDSLFDLPKKMQIEVINKTFAHDAKRKILRLNSLLKESMIEDIIKSMEDDIMKSSKKE